MVSFAKEYGDEGRGKVVEEEDKESELEVIQGSNDEKSSDDE